MAIIKNIWLRGSKQRLGGAVTYMLAGQQVTRELAAKVKNPRTPAQMIQRTKLSNLVNFYKSMRSWAKVGAFSNKPQRWSDYNAFVSANIGTQPAYLTKNQAAAGCAVVAPYIISRGSLPRVQTTFNSVRTDFDSNIYVGELDTPVDFTLGEVSTAIIANNNGIMNGDQISIISVIQRTTETGPFVIQRAYEFTLDTTSTQNMNDVLPSEVLAFQPATGEQNVLSHSAEEANMGCAFIISRKVGGKILTGDAQLALTPAAETFLGGYRTSAALQNAIASYGVGESNFLDPNTRGDSSTQATLNLQLLSMTINNRTYSNGQELGTLGNPTSVTFNFSSDLTGLTPGRAYFSVYSGDTEIFLENGVVSGSAVTYPISAEKLTELRQYWSEIIHANVRVGDDGGDLDFTYNHNGGEADPGDVTP